MLDKWETEKHEGVCPFWKGEKYREFKSFFKLQNKLEAWEMLDLIEDYLQSDEGLKHNASLGTGYADQEPNQIRWALFPRT